MNKISNTDVAMNEFTLPFTVEKDSQYFDVLESKLYTYLRFVETHDEQLVRDTRNETWKSISKIIRAIEYYYAGDITRALVSVKSLLKKYISTGDAIKPIEQCYAFKGAAADPPEIYIEKYRDMYAYMRDFYPLIFYRARKEKEQLDIENLLHISFDNRGIIKNERFSINGLPCLYLASTTYGAWIEMGRPSENEFQVSAFQLPSDIKVLDLTIQQHLINGVASLSTEEEKEKLIRYMKVFPLVIATSCAVNQKNRIFKSEYIIPQLLMLACKSLHIDAIAYLSKQEIDMKAYPQAVNLAILMEKGADAKYWRRINELKMTKPAIYSEFLMRPRMAEAVDGYRAFVNALFYGNYSDSITLANKPACYTKTDFSRFDEYLAKLDFYNVGEYLKKKQTNKPTIWS